MKDMSKISGVAIVDSSGASGGSLSCKMKGGAV